MAGLFTLRDRSSLSPWVVGFVAVDDSTEVARAAKMSRLS